MTAAKMLVFTILIAFAAAAAPRDPSSVDPPFPRIGNCYGAGLSWRTWEQGGEYWSKLDLIIGGGYDLHYDWEHERWQRAFVRLEENIGKLREANPDALVLPYVDVIEGPDSPTVPKHWWSLNDEGERWSGWPGYFRIRTELPEVLQFNLDKVRDEVMSREMFDGVFYDCWSPDDWLVPRTGELRDGKAIVMLNAWNLPRTGIETLNGALAEDEINRVIDGQVDFEDFLARYLRWCSESRKPAVTMIVCRPRVIDDDPWRWKELTQEQRVAMQEEVGKSDEQTMRFGLATTLMGDGYFGYDCGTMSRGNWWWYDEYDAPLGSPRGPATRRPDGTWQREFDGGTVIVNGTSYDAVVELPEKRVDMSTGRVGTGFSIPMYDGRIYLPSDAPDSPGDDVAPRITVTPPAELLTTTLDGGITVVQAPSGLELRFTDTGALQDILWHGSRIMSGGWPVVAAPPFKNFGVESATCALEPSADANQARLSYTGEFVHETQKVTYVGSCMVDGNEFVLDFAGEAATDLDLRLWRHYFRFPVTTYAGATAEAGGEPITFPAELGETDLLGGRKIAVERDGLRIEVESSIPMGLVDERKWGADAYLLACYPVGGKVRQGAQWSVQMAVTVSELPVE